MRASTIVTLFYLAASVAPSVAFSSILSERMGQPPAKTDEEKQREEEEKLKLELKYHAVFMEEMKKDLIKIVAAVIAALGTSAGIDALENIGGKTNGSAVNVKTREKLERFGGRVQHELAVRAFKRKLPTTTLDNLD